MKTIMAKFRRVARYGVAVFLAAASCFSAFAEIICTPGEPYQQGTQWYVDVYCHGDIDPVHTTVPIDADPGSGGGSCTNCTAMSPAACQSIKSSIIEQCSFLEDSFRYCSGLASSLQEQADSAMADINGLFDEGWNFYSLGGSVSGISYSDLFNTSTRNYYPPYQDTDDQTRAAYYGANEGVYNYFQSSVVPVLSSVSGSLNGIYNDLYVISSVSEESIDAVSVLSAVASGMNCAACEASGSGSGGGGGTSGGGTTPSGCPCSEYINAVKTAVDNCHTKLTELSSKVSSIKTRLDEWDELLKQIKNDVHAIRQTTDRMDDFFRDDTEVNFKKLIEHVLVLSNAVFNAQVKLPPNLYWTEYTNATQFLTAEGSSITWLDKGKLIEAGADGAVIDFGEYGQLNWFQRMEFLLGHIAGIFSSTNSTDADFSEEQKTKIESAEDDIKNAIGGDNDSIGQLDATKTILNQMVQYVENMEDSLNPFHGLFDYSSGSTRSITFLPDVSVENDLLGNTMPTITMDLTETGDGSFSISDLVDLAHNLTTFLWYVSFLIIDVLAIIKFVQCLIALNRWYWKIYNSWVSTMFSGGGR